MMPWLDVGPVVAALVVGAVVAGLFVAARVVARGGLGANAFVGSPRRDVGLSALDVATAGLIIILGLTVHGRIQLAWYGGQPPVPDLMAPAEVAAWTLVGQFLCQLPTVVFLLWRTGRDHWGDLGLRPRRAGREAAAAAAALVLALPLIYGLTAAVIALGRAAGAEEPFVGHDLLPVFERAAGNWSIVPLVASVVLVAAVLEEMIFRGLLQTVLHGAGGKSRPWAAILVASVCFAMFHASVPWQSLPGLFVLGIIFGWLYERHGSLLPSVLAHAGFNAVNVAMVVF